MNQQLLQVVLLAGFEADFFLTLDEKLPKCLMPVANKPLISYSLEQLEKFGYKSILIVSGISQKYKKMLQTFLDNEYQGQLQCEIINFVPDQDNGSEVNSEVQALCSPEVSSKIQRDFLLLNCDSINNIDLSQLEKIHVQNSPFITMSLMTKQVQQQSGRTSNDVFLINKNTNQIGKIIDQEYVNIDFPLSVKPAVLHTLGSATIDTTFTDPQVYICKKEVIKVMNYLQDEQLDQKSFKNDFLPYISDFQFNDKIKQLLSEQIRIYAFQTPNSYFYSIIDNQHLQTINANVFSEYGLIKNQLITPQNGNYLKEYEENKNFISDIGVNIDQTANISNSVIGKQVKIGKNVVIKDSIIQYGCEIGDDTVLENCVVLFKVNIGKKNVLTNCGIIGNTQDSFQSQDTL